MADMSFLRAELHEQSGRNRSYYRGGDPGVNGGQPLKPLTYRSVRDELVDGNRRQDKLMAKLMQAYESIEQGEAVGFRDPQPRKPRRPLKLPRVVRSKSGATPAQQQQRRRKPSTAPAKSTTRPRPPQQRTATAPGPQTATRTSSALWAPKRNAMAEKAAEQRFLARKLNTKPKRTAADKTLARLEKEADGLRVCLNKMGPKGRGITLFVLLTGDSTLTCIGADNTRGLKYRLRLTADAELADRGVTEQMHVLHALAVAVRISEVPRDGRKKKGGGRKGGGSGWGDDLRLDVDPEIMVEQMSRPRNLNPEEEVDRMEREEEEAAKQRAREANTAIKQRREAEAERIRKIDAAIKSGKKPALKGEEDSDDDFEDSDSDDDDDDDDDGYNEDDDAGAAFNKQFNKKPEVVEDKKKKQQGSSSRSSSRSPRSRGWQPKGLKKRESGPPRRTDGSEGHPEVVRFRPSDIRVQTWRELDDHPMLVTALFRPPTSEVIVEARDPKLDYQYRLTFKTKPPGEDTGRQRVDDPEEVEQITNMLTSLIPQLKVSGANAQSLGRMTLG